jgi:hypothetical protein
MITAEKFWQKRNGGKPSEKATKDGELISPIQAVILMNDFHKEALRSELIAYDKWMSTFHWDEVLSPEEAVDIYLK